MANRPMQISIRVQGAGVAVGQLRQVAAMVRQIQQGQGGSAYVNVFNYGRGGGSGGGSRGSTFGSRLLGAVNSTRLNFGGASPLVGRLTGLFGSELAGPLTLAAVAASGFAVAVHQATETINTYGRAATISGAGPGQLARLGALGLAPTEAASAANSLRGALASNPMAQFARSQLGLGFVGPQQLGSQDNAKVLADTLEALRRVTNAEEQLRLARMLGLEGMLDELRVSERVYRERQADAARRAANFGDPQTIQQGRDFNAEVKRTGELWNELGATFGKETLPAAMTVVSGINQMLQDMLPTVKQLGQFTNQTFNDLIDFIAQTGAIQAGMAPVDAYNLVKGARQAQNALNNATNAAQNANTNALKNLTQAINGMNGGGARARGALPPNLIPLLTGASAGSPSEFSAILNGRAVRLGAWSL